MKWLCALWANLGWCAAWGVWCIVDGRASLATANFLMAIVLCGAAVHQYHKEKTSHDR